VDDNLSSHRIDAHSSMHMMIVTPPSGPSWWEQESSKFFSNVRNH
jgi:hypothetical protein